MNKRERGKIKHSNWTRKSTTSKIKYPSHDRKNKQQNAKINEQNRGYKNRSE